MSARSRSVNSNARLCSDKIARWLRFETSLIIHAVQIMHAMRHQVKLKAVSCKLILWLLRRDCRCKKKLLHKNLRYKTQVFVCLKTFKLDCQLPVVLSKKQTIEISALSRIRLWLMVPQLCVMRYTRYTSRCWIEVSQSNGLIITNFHLIRLVEIWWISRPPYNTVWLSCVSLHGWNVNSPHDGSGSLSTYT